MSALAAGVGRFVLNSIASDPRKRRGVRNLVIGSVAGVILIVLVSAYALMGAIQGLGFGGATALGCLQNQEEIGIPDDADLSTMDTQQQMCVSLVSSIGAWGGYQNGQIPLSALQALSWAPNRYLRPDAAAAAEKMNIAFKAKFGSDMGVSDAYRSLQGQIDIKASEGNLAATPGTSNHGWGLAVDWGSGINTFGSPQHQWMVDNAPGFGWTHPAWAEANGSKPEAWHWEYTAGAAGDAGGALAGAADPNSPDGARQTAQGMVSGYGWGTEQYVCLNALWTKESGWRVNADNPTSDAYGIPQALPGSKMASIGTDWQTNARTQIAWGLAYISSRYGSPCSAWEHSQAMNWY